MYSFYCKKCKIRIEEKFVIGMMFRKKYLGNLKFVLHDESKKYKRNILCPNCKKYMKKKFISDEKILSLSRIIQYKQFLKIILEKLSAWTKKIKLKVSGYIIRFQVCRLNLEKNLDIRRKLFSTQCKINSQIIKDANFLGTAENFLKEVECMFDKKIFENYL